jgi:hypothetical protein
VPVNNAGIAPAAGAIHEWSLGEVLATDNANLVAAIELCRQVIPRMLQRDGGHIVNVSSLAGTSAIPGLTVYGSSKAGLTHFTAGLRADLKHLPIGGSPMQQALRMPWRRHPDGVGDGPYYVTAAELRARRFRDLPAVYWTALRLRRIWPGVSGAVAIRLWAQPWRRRSGALTVWRREHDLDQFVRSPNHAAIMDRFRGRVTVHAESWITLSFPPDMPAAPSSPWSR